MFDALMLAALVLGLVGCVVFAYDDHAAEQKRKRDAKQNRRYWGDDRW